MKNRRNCYICKEKFENKYLPDERYGKVRDHSHYTENIEVLHIGYVIQNIVYSKIFLQTFMMDYHFITKVLAEVFKEQITYLEEKTEK